MNLRRAIASNRRGTGAGGVAASALASGTTLLTFSEGSYQRVVDNESYLTSASTVAKAAVDVMPLEDRGDGYGAIAQFERPYQQLLANSEDFSAWSPIFATVTANTTTAPDGTSTADTLALNADAFAQVLFGLNASNTPNGSVCQFSVWMKCASGTESMALKFQDKTGAIVTGSTVTVTTTWQRFVATCNVGTGAGNTAWRIVNGSATARSVYVWGAQLEIASFPSSYITAPNGGSAGVRYSGVLTFLSAQVPLWLREQAQKWTVYPYWANTDLSSGDTKTIYSYGTSAASNQLRMRHDGTGVKVEAIVGGVTKASSGYVTNAKHAQLAITVDPSTAIISVNGSAGSAGTPWTWPAGVQVRVGGLFALPGYSNPVVAGSGSEFDGRISQPVVP